MMDKKETLQYLGKLHVNYELREHQAVYNMAELEQIKLPHPAADAKNLFLRGDKKEIIIYLQLKVIKG